MNHFCSGGAEGILNQSQVFSGIDYQYSFSTDAKGFGIALSANVDVDNNKYPDLAVGTLSDYIVLLRWVCGCKNI